MKAKGIVLILAFTFVAFAASALAEVVIEAWTETYNGTGDGDDGTNAIALDSDGNVYVTGFAFNGDNNDYITIKYDTDGTELWAETYNGIGDDRDKAWDIAVDAYNNAYVTGASDLGGKYDIVTIKYDTGGNDLWTMRYNGTGNNNDCAYSISLDASENAYVTGYSWNGSSHDYVTIKYDTDGTELWAKSYDGIGNGEDRAYSIAVDSDGNAYVTGNSDNGSNMDWATIKYDTNGTELWVENHNGTGNGYDLCHDIAVDADGSVYVIGTSDNGSNSDYAIIKYDKDGNEEWGMAYNGPGNSNDTSQAVLLDSGGSVYVTGNARNANNGDIVTIKFDTDGAALWLRTYNGIVNDNDFASGIALDPDGGVYVTGYSWISSSQNYNYITIKYDADGNEAWVMSSNGTANGYDRAESIAVDEHGNAYVTGYTTGDSNNDITTVKYAVHDCIIADAGYDNGEVNPDNVCEYCDADTSATTWTANNGVSCDDGADCSTGDVCTDGVCMGVPDNSLCDDGNPCSDDYCATSLGMCLYYPNTDPCDDGLWCNGADTCQSGACITHTGDPCQAGEICNEEINICEPSGDDDDDCGNSDWMYDYIMSN